MDLSCRSNGTRSFQIVRHLSPCLTFYMYYNPTGRWNFSSSFSFSFRNRLFSFLFNVFFFLFFLRDPGNRLTGYRMFNIELGLHFDTRKQMVRIVYFAVYQKFIRYSYYFKFDHTIIFILNDEYCSTLLVNGARSFR